MLYASLTKVANLREKEKLYLSQTSPDLTFWRAVASITEETVEIF